MITTPIVHNGCEGDGFSVVVDNVTYDETNPIGQVTLPSSSGCDSIVDVSLNFAVPSAETIDDLRCAGDGFSVVVDNQTFDENQPSGSVLLQTCLLYTSPSPRDS